MGGGVRWSISEEGEAVKPPVLRLGVFSPVRADLMRQFRSAGNRDKREGHSIYIMLRERGGEREGQERERERDSENW